jgi:hypothetical protein
MATRPVQAWDLKPSIPYQTGTPKLKHAANPTVLDLQPLDPDDVKYCKI